MPDHMHLKRYKIFQQFNNIIAFTTTKQSLQTSLPRFTGDKETIFGENRNQLARLLRINENQLFFPRQTHSNCVAEIHNPIQSGLQNIDALVTNEKATCLCVQTADCVPILLFDPVKNVIAAVHAGWRGTVSLIVSNSIQMMQENYGSTAKNIVAAVGPSISPDIYEVGNEVIKAAEVALPNPSASILVRPDGKMHFDLWQANREILIHCGLDPKKIEISGECSFKNESKYFSARRDGIETGRMATGIMLV